MERVCARIEQGELIASASKAEGVTRSAVWEWARKHADLGDMYARARDASADALAEEALEVARASTSETYGADRVRIDTLKWAAAKRRPKEYGDKQSIEVSGGIEHLHLDALRSISAKARIDNSLPSTTSPKLLGVTTSDAQPIDTVQDLDTE